MAAIELNLNPENRQIRQFGLVALAALPLLGWLFAGRPGPAGWTPFHTQLIGGLALAGLAMAIVGLAAPKALKPVLLGAMLLAYPIGLVLSEVIMLLIYLLVFAPMALVFRIMGRDALERELDRNSSTYWSEKQQAPDARSYFRQS
jgi:hypothetical protein